MSNKTLQVVVRCWHPEHYDAVSHAVIPIDIKLIEYLAKRIIKAAKIKLYDPSFTSLEYDDYSPEFLDITAEDIGLSEDDYDILSDGGYHILPASFTEKDMDNLEEVAMRPCWLRVTDDDFQWYGYDKYGDAGCRAETYCLQLSDLKCFAKELGVGICEKCGRCLLERPSGGYVDCACGLEME